MADLTGGPDFSIPASIREANTCLREGGSVIHESIPASVAHLLSFSMRSVEAMRRTSIVEVRIGAIESTFSCNNTRIGDLKSQIE